MKDRGNERIELLSPDETVKNTLIDLSFSGAAMNWPVDLKKNDQVQVKIREYLLDAKVVYSQPRAKEFRIGIHFINVSPEVQKPLKTLVEEFSRGVPITFEIVEKR
jgi:hypothetical protein